MGSTTTGQSLEVTRWSRRLRGTLWWLLSVSVFVGLWEVGHFTGLLDEYIFPAPHQFLPLLFDPSGFQAVAVRANDIFDGPYAIFGAVGSTFLRVMAGMAIGFTSGVVVGFFVHYQRWFGYIATPILRLMAGISAVAWIPLAVVLLKGGERTAVGLVAIAIFFSLALSVSETVKSVPYTYIDAARILGASRRDIFLRVILPHSLPKLYSRMRFNFFGAWMTVLLAELFDIEMGLGLIIFLASSYLNIKLAYLAIVLIGACGGAIDLILRVLERRLFWYEYATVTET